MKVVKIGNKKIIKFDIATLLMLFLFLMTNCLYFIDVESLKTIGAFGYADIWMVLLIIFIVVVLFKYRKIHLSKSEFGWILLIQIALFVIAAIQEYRLTGQSIVLGLRPQRFKAVVLLSYFPIRKLFLAGKITPKRIKEAVCNFAIVECVLSIVQQIVFSRFVFMHCQVNERYGSVRLYVSASIITFAMLCATESIFKKEKSKKNYIVLIIGTIFLLYVNKGRWQFFSIAIAIVIGVILIKGISKVKIAYIAALLVGIIILMQTPLVKDIVFQSNNSNGSGSNMAIRYEARELYIQTLKKHPILGGGSPNDNYTPAAKAAGKDSGYFLNDNGIFGYAYIFGLLGVTLLIVWYGKMLYMSVKVYRKNTDYMPLMFITMQLVMLFNLFAWLWQNESALIMVIAMCYLETKYKLGDGRPVYMIKKRGK